MQIDPSKAIWYENERGERWSPKVFGDKPPEGFDTRVTEAMLLCHRIEKLVDGAVTDAGRVVTYPVGREPEADLVLAMCRPSMTESKVILQRALLERRQHLPAKLADRLAFSAQVALGRVSLPGLYSFEQALATVSRACDRCRGALAYTYGLQRGFSISSAVYADHAGRCDFCKPAQPPTPTRETTTILPPAGEAKA